MNFKQQFQHLQDSIVLYKLHLTQQTSIDSIEHKNTQLQSHLISQCNVCDEMTQIITKIKDSLRQKEQVAHLILVLTQISLKMQFNYYQNSTLNVLSQQGHVDRIQKYIKGVSDIQQDIFKKQRSKITKENFMKQLQKQVIKMRIKPQIERLQGDCSANIKQIEHINKQIRILNSDQKKKIDQLTSDCQAKQDDITKANDHIEELCFKQQQQQQDLIQYLENFNQFKQQLDKNYVDLQNIQKQQVLLLNQQQSQQSRLKSLLNTQISNQIIQEQNTIQIDQLVQMALFTEKQQTEVDHQIKTINQLLQNDLFYKVDSTIKQFKETGTDVKEPEQILDSQQSEQPIIQQEDNIVESAEEVQTAKEEDQPTVESVALIDQPQIEKVEDGKELLLEKHERAVMIRQETPEKEITLEPPVLPDNHSEPEIQQKQEQIEEKGEEEKEVQPEEVVQNEYTEQHEIQATNNEEPQDIETVETEQANIEEKQEQDQENEIYAESNEVIPKYQDISDDEQQDVEIVNTGDQVDL